MKNILKYRKQLRNLLNCSILKGFLCLLIYFQLSWFRKKDRTLLTVGLSTYSSDDRFFVEHTRHLGNWALRIKNAREDDEGLYECQISSHPPQSIFIELRIVGEYFLLFLFTF